MAKIQGICPGERIIRDSELGFGVKKFRIQGISSGTAGDPGKRDPGQRGATVLECTWNCPVLSRVGSRGSTMYAIVLQYRGHQTHTVRYGINEGGEKEKDGLLLLLMVQVLEYWHGK